MHRLMILPRKSEMKKKADEFSSLYDEYRSRETVGLLRHTDLIHDSCQPGEAFEESLQSKSEGFSVGQQIGISKGNAHFFARKPR